MMVPYHLRVGKQVDRLIFVELLTRLTSVRPIHDYTYVGLGGPLMDDFRLMHGAFGFRRMISIEGDENVVRRQEFNKPTAIVEIRHDLSSAFLEGFDFEAHDGVVLWLDYTSPSEYESQFSDVETALRRMEDGDILRVTFNIDRATLKADGERFQEKSEDERAERRRQILKSRMGEYYPNEPVPEGVFRGSCDFTPVMLNALALTASRARAGKRAKFQRLMSLAYHDSSRMLTVTGLLTTEPAQLLSNPALSRFSFLTTSEPRDIGTPALSTAERIFVEKRLPGDLGEIRKTLPYLSEQELQNISAYYRYLPHFQRSNVLI